MEKNESLLKHNEELIQEAARSENFQSAIRVLGCVPDKEKRGGRNLLMLHLLWRKHGFRFQPA